jgi:nucleotide-binding universal stress UspA family protein
MDATAGASMITAAYVAPADRGRGPQPRPIRPMRVAVAIDGSASSEPALKLIESIAWPAGSHIRIVQALDHLAGLLGPALSEVDTDDAHGMEQVLTTSVRRSLDDAGARVAQPLVEVSQVLVRGGPAAAVIAEARRFKADLIVTGSREWASDRRSVGSVSAAIVEHAPVSVLVARRPHLGSAVIATDATGSSRPVIAWVIRSPLFRDVAMHVISVCELPEPWRSEPFLPLVYSGTMKSYAHLLERARLPYIEAAVTAFDELRDAGFTVDWERLDGSAARQLVTAADERDADLIVVGARGDSTRPPIALGATTRSVVLHAHTSVLVVRPAA